MTSSDRSPLKRVPGIGKTRAVWNADLGRWVVYYGWLPGQFKYSSQVSEVDSPHATVKPLPVPKRKGRRLKRR